MILGLQLYGWFLDKRGSIAGVLVGQFLLGWGNGFFLPGIISYLSAQKQSIAAAASSASFSMNFIACGKFPTLDCHNSTPLEFFFRDLIIFFQVLQLKLQCTSLMQSILVPWFSFSPAVCWFPSRLL